MPNDHSTAEIPSPTSLEDQIAILRAELDQELDYSDELAAKLEAVTAERDALRAEAAEQDRIRRVRAIDFRSADKRDEDLESAVGKTFATLADAHKIDPAIEDLTDDGQACYGERYVDWLCDLRSAHDAESCSLDCGRKTLSHADYLRWLDDERANRRVRDERNEARVLVRKLMEKQ